MSLAFAADERHPLVDALFAGPLAGLPPAARAIDAGDFMYRFLLEHRYGDRDLALVDYFASGASAAGLVRRIADWRWGEAANGMRVLDFASGFGRVARFLAATFGRKRLTVADVLAPAVEFQAAILGLDAHRTPGEADAARTQLEGSGRFDLVVVASLFSHLPRHRFGPWLRTLAQLLTPGGLLLMSVHDEAVLPAGRILDDGFAFERSTEIPLLSTEEYGVAWTDAGFMSRTIAEATGGAGVWRRIPRALWAYQDLYLVAPDGDLPASPLEPACDPLGRLFGIELGDDGRTLDLHGWAVDPAGPGVEEVEVAVDGVVRARTRPDTPCPEVAAELGPTIDAAHPGWFVRLTSPDGAWDPRALLQVVARSRSGG